MKPLDLSGHRYGKLTVISREPSGRYGCRWKCLCDCGAEMVATAGAMRAAKVLSCGCAQRLAAADSCRERSTTHGMARTRLYTIWRAMKARCERPGSASYPGYGGRGITVCAEWSASFETFMSWAICHGYAAALSIDRIDFNGNYAPDNCRWATPIQQSNNRRSSRMITYSGRTMSATQWARETGVKAGTIMARITAGWPDDKLMSPTRPCR